MLWTIAVALTILWLLGLVSGYTMGNFIHILLVIAIIVYMDILESNIARMSQLAQEAGVRLRPHTKIHECPDVTADLHGDRFRDAGPNQIPHPGAP